MRLGSLPALLVLFSLPQIPGCDTSKIQETLKKVTYENADSILTKSQSNIVVLGRVSEKSDSVITEKVTKTTEKIENLTHEIKVLKRENNELKKKHIDTNGAIDQHFGLLPISADPSSE
jgi:uncharacterized protein YcaQ